jgi:hypothetical protein
MNGFAEAGILLLPAVRPLIPARARGLAVVPGLFALAIPALAATPPASPGPRVVVDGTAFRIALPDGSVPAQERLPGTVLTLVGCNGGAAVHPHRCGGAGGP